tara:strand:- start:11681 stop:12007 length:327 start_codon:yes stop_codon:yes gene_type:complete
MKQPRNELIEWATTEESSVVQKEGKRTVPSISRRSPQPLFSRSIVRVNRGSAYSHELRFALIRNERIQKLLHSVARSFSKRPYPQFVLRGNADTRQLNGFLSGLGALG